MRLNYLDCLLFKYRMMWLMTKLVCSPCSETQGFHYNLRTSLTFYKGSFVSKIMICMICMGQFAQYSSKFFVSIDWAMSSHYCPGRRPLNMMTSGLK